MYVTGTCERAAFYVKEGSASGLYPSANAAVNAVRSHVEATNAYLYIEFQVGTSWRLADDLRYDPELSIPVDPVEEKILEDLKNRVRQKYKGLAPEEVHARAEIAFDKNPEYVAKWRKAWNPVFFGDDERA